MSLRRYAYRCPKGCEMFESDQMRSAVCPDCGTTGNRIFGGTPLFRPTATKNIGKKRRGTEKWHD